MKLLLFCLLFVANFLYSQETAVFNIVNMPGEGLVLDNGWSYQTGDNTDWASPDFDASGWAPIDPTIEINLLPDIAGQRMIWLRIDFEIGTKPTEALGLAVNQVGASEIYLNGRLIHCFGQFDTDPARVRAYDPLQVPIHLPADSVGRYTLAVRYAQQPNLHYTNIFAATKNRLFYATVIPLVPTLHAQQQFFAYKIGIDIFVIGVVLMLFVLHSAMYFYQKSNKIQFAVACYLFGGIISRCGKLIGQNHHWLEERILALNTANWTFATLVAIGLTTVIYRMAQQRLDRYFYIQVVYQLGYAIVSTFSFVPMLQTRLLLLGNIFGFFILIRIVRIGLKKKIKRFDILGVSIAFAIFGLTFVTLAFLFWGFGISVNGYNVMKYGISPYLVDLVFTACSLAIPTGLSLFVGIEIREMNKALSRQVAENDQLKNEAIQQEQEKQHLLATQNETLEQQVTERTAELNQSLENLKTAQNQLVQSEKLASLGELTAGIAHEIQNPLNFVNNFAELSIDLTKDINEELEKPELDREYIGELLTDLTHNQEKINYHGKRASSIVKGMLSHSRMSTGARETTDLNKLADEYLRLSYHGLRARDKSFNADFKTDFDENLPKIEVVPQDIGRVLLNLLNNAFYAVFERRKNSQNQAQEGAVAPYQPMVTVSTQQSENHIIIKVMDNGIGIPDTVQEKVFQPFFTTKPTGEGTGLGLSLAFDIITKGHGGSINIESKEGERTTFVIQLPR